MAPLTNFSFKGPFTYNFTCDGQSVQVATRGKLYDLLISSKPFSQAYESQKSKEAFNWGSKDSKHDAYQVKDFA